MSIQALNWVFKQDIERSGAKFVLVALANYANEQNICYPSQRRIAEMCSMNSRSVIRHLEYLEENGFIKRERTRDESGRAASNTYLLMLDRSISPCDKLSLGHVPPCDNLSLIHVTKTTSPCDKLSPIYNKEYTKEENLKKDTHNARAREESPEAGEKTDPPYLPKTKLRALGGDYPPALDDCPAADNDPAAFAAFRNAIEEWHVETFGTFIRPDMSTASDIQWLFAGGFTIDDVRKFYLHATTDPEETKWRRGRVTFATVCKGIAAWRAQKKAYQPTAADMPQRPRPVDFCDMCDDYGGIREIDEQGAEAYRACDHGGRTRADGPTDAWRVRYEQSGTSRDTAWLGDV